MKQNFPFTPRVLRKLSGLALLTASAGAAQAQSFGTAATFSAGPSITINPLTIAVGDVNSDGKPDAITANYNNPSLSLFLGNGAGGFSLQSNLLATGGTYPAAVVLADVNKDGKLDVLVANYGGNNMGVLLGDGQGNFTLQSSLPAVGSGAFSMATADVNSDGKLDAVLLNYSSNTISVLLGNGTGGFTVQNTYPSTGSGSRPIGGAIADINGDGKPDLVTANNSSNTLGILLGNGTGGFTLQANSPSTGGTGPRNPKLVDINNDGKLDVLVPNSSGILGVLLGNGQGGFSLQGSSPTTGANSNPYDVAVADLNNDGKLDAYTSNYNANTIGILQGNGAGGFTLQNNAPATGSSPSAIALADINNDGKLDAVTSNFGGSMSALLNTTLYPNNALAFDGNNDYIDFSSSAALPTGNTDFTYESWYFNPGGQTGDRWLAWFGTAGTNMAAIIGYNGATGKIQFNHFAAGNDLASNVVLPTGQWSHLAVVWHGATLTADIYLNGALAQTLQYSAALNLPSGGSFQLGTFAGNSAFCVNGRLDEVRLYTTALTAANIQADMFSTVSAVPAKQVAYYNFDQGTASGTNTSISNLANRAGTGSTGTLTNFALTGTTSNWVRSFPTITGLSASSGVMGSNVTVAGTNLLDATGFAFNGAAATPFATPTDDFSATVTIPMGASTGPLSVASSGLAAYNGPVFTPLTNDLVVNTVSSVAAGYYTSLTVQNGGVATFSGNTTVNGPVLVQNGGILNTNCQALTGSGSFTLAAGGTLGICDAAGIATTGSTGAVQTTGTRSFSPDASYVYNGTAAQSTGSGLPSQLRSLTTTNANTVTLSAPVSVAQTLTVGGAGNLQLNGQALTLLSTSGGTALVVNSGTGAVLGNTATVQRYLDQSCYNGMGYRHYSAPVSGSTVNDLATTTGFTPVINPAYNGSATPGQALPFPTVFGYDQSLLSTSTSNYSAFDKGFFSPSALSDQLTVGKGYAVQLDATQLVDFTGQLNTGTKSFTLSRNTDATAPDAGWALVGNPYPAPLDWSQVAPADRAGLDGSIYVVQSSGPYTGSYRTYINNVSTSITNDPLIGSGQGFFVRVSAGQGSGTLTFRNSQRVTDYATQATVARTATDPRALVRLSLRTGAGQADGLVVYAEAGATAGFDGQYDAGKLLNSTGLNLASLSAANQPLAIDGRPAFAAGTVVPLTVGVPAAGTYTLVAVALNNLPAGLNAYLTDAQTGQTTQLSAQTSYSFSVTAAEAAATLTGRFALRFGPATALAAISATLANEVTIYPNPAHASFTVQLPAVVGASQVQAQLLNALGQVVRQQRTALPATGATFTVDTDGLATGVYTLRLQAGTTTLAKRVILN